MATQLHEPTQPTQATQRAGLAIEARHLHKSYRVGDAQVEILHGVSLGVQQGQMVAVMSPSGCGK